MSRDTEIIIHSSIAFIVGIIMVVAFFLMDGFLIGEAFDEFRMNDCIGIIQIDEFESYLWHYTFIIILVSFFGLFMRNFVTNILGILWSALQLPWLMHNITFYQAYFSTTFEGKLFFAEFGVCILVLTIALIGLLRTCLRAYTRRKENQA